MPGHIVVTLILIKYQSAGQLYLGQVKYDDIKSAPSDIFFGSIEPNLSDYYLMFRESYRLYRISLQSMGK